MEADDDEDDEGDEAEEAGEENDRPYNLRQRKTVQRYEALPIGTCSGHIHTFIHTHLLEHLKHPYDQQMFPCHSACAIIGYFNE